MSPLRSNPHPLYLASVLALSSLVSSAQQAAPTIVQPGAPGAASKTLTPDAATKSAVPRPPSKADTEFMQGMIMHHGQAVEMTALIVTHTTNPDVVSIGSKIKLSQTDEMAWMKRWLTERGLPIEDDMGGMDMSKMDMGDMPPMPGMLTKKQMEALRKARGKEFDHLFLTGMMQHHGGALTMVKELFANPGAGQDPWLFDFANDVDNTQQAEIDIMRHMLRRVEANQVSPAPKTTGSETTKEKK